MHREGEKILHIHRRSPWSIQVNIEHVIALPEAQGEKKKKKTLSQFIKQQLKRKSPIKGRS